NPKSIRPSLFGRHHARDAKHGISRGSATDLLDGRGRARWGASTTPWKALQSQYLGRVVTIPSRSSGNTVDPLPGPGYKRAPGIPGIPTRQPGGLRAAGRKRMAALEEGRRAGDPEGQDLSLEPGISVFERSAGGGVEWRRAM